MPDLVVLGAGLAGCEAALAAARRGLSVRLVEMKPRRRTPAQSSDRFAELVCTNSLRSAVQATGPGLLKEEMRRAGSVVVEAADRHAVPAGGALAVDREKFSAAIEDAVRTHPRIEVVCEEATAIPDHPSVVVATGPLTSDALARAIREKTGIDSMSFVDATAPIVDAATIDMSKVFVANRYDRGEADYLNCPMNRDRYERFVDAVREAESVVRHEFEEARFFEGCMPFEEMARRGRETLAFGPMKPVGIRHPETGETYHAVVQLRQETAFADMYNIVGFQTRLKWPDQQRVLRMIPGLENAEFLRLGTMHRNTFLRAPALLDGRFRLKSDPRVRFAGQLSGVEGYVESAASGWLAGLYAAAEHLGADIPEVPDVTAHGCLISLLTKSDPDRFQPMNVNFGLMPPLDKRMPKKNRKEAYAQRALAAFDAWLAGLPDSLRIPLLPGEKVASPSSR